MLVAGAAGDEESFAAPALNAFIRCGLPQPEPPLPPPPREEPPPQFAAATGADASGVVAEEPPPTPPRRPSNRIPVLKLGALELGLQVGAGSLGSTRAAWVAVAKRSPADPTCLKRLPLTAATSREALEREVSALCAVRHENLRSVRGLVLDEGEAPSGGLFCELCFLRLPDLLDEIPLEQNDAGASNRSAWGGCLLGLGADMARGLEHLHGAGLAHHALKPENVLLERPQNRSSCVVAKLADFAVVPLLRAHMPRGMPHLFLAPELLKEHDRLGGWPAPPAPPTPAELERAHRAADVWSLGCLLVTLAAREPPFAALRHKVGYRFQNFKLSLSALKELTSCLASGRERPCAALLAPATAVGLPPAVAELAERCTALQPRARPRAAEALMELEAVGGAFLMDEFDLPTVLMRRRRWSEAFESEEDRNTAGGRASRQTRGSIRFAEPKQLVVQMEEMSMKSPPNPNPGERTRARRKSAVRSPELPRRVYE